MNLTDQLAEALRQSAKYIDALESYYGTNLSVVGWHLNGALEPLDSFFDNNREGDELSKASAAIAAYDAQVAAAAEEITEEWLVANGWHNEYDDDGSYWSFPRSDIVLRGHWNVFLGESFLREVVAIGQLLRLVEAIEGEAT